MSEQRASTKVRPITHRARNFPRSAQHHQTRHVACAQHPTIERSSSTQQPMRVPFQQRAEQAHAQRRHFLPTFNHTYPPSSSRPPARSSTLPRPPLSPFPDLERPTHTPSSPQARIHAHAVAVSLTYPRACTTLLSDEAIFSFSNVIELRNRISFHSHRREGYCSPLCSCLRLGCEPS